MIGCFQIPDTILACLMGARGKFFMVCYLGRDMGPTERMREYLFEEDDEHTKVEFAAADRGTIC